ncbi:MAG: nicotinate-nucleotide adenylyltransferase [Lachnospiraceae bacterium]|nr:nicotinate-nucleotide adenylyltransferase [Lachnospiraceae bacterium]
MKRIGIIGGTFDPVHNGHIMLAESALLDYDLDMVGFMPTGVSPHKGRVKESTLSQRLDMLKFAIACNDKFFLMRDEIDSNDEICFTYKTLTRLKEKHPDTHYFFIIGGDSLKDFKGWRHPEIICKKATILAAVRDEIEGSSFKGIIDDLNRRFDADIRPLKAKKFHVSSHELREMIKCGENIENLVPVGLYEYVKKNKIYGHQRDKKET